MKKIKLKTVNSTNNHASSLLSGGMIVEETVIFTEAQTNGKGLGSNTWHSDDYKNLLFSIVVFPNLKVDRHFSLSMIVSLAICDYLLLKGVKAQIKWPNDIYVKNKKIAGILIENSIYGDTIKSSILGIGLNLNQVDFPAELPNPISLTNITSEFYDVDMEIDIISKIISDKLYKFKKKNFVTIRKYYLEKLYRLGCMSEFKAGNTTFLGHIENVKRDGHIVISNLEFEPSEYYFKEIEFVG
jgi:BirA family transcriptional regulator, biotin operon repressor / biotin---[acetyl-CoA-carboxylase] ligase